MELFQKIITEILRPLRKNRIEYCIIGGLAVILLGVRRGTADFDIVIPEDKIEEALKTVYRRGFKLVTNIDEQKGRLYYCATLEQAIAYLKLTAPKALKLNKGGIDGLFGDIWLKTIVPFAELKKHSKKYKLYNELISVASPNDLIKLKKIAGRAVDKQDICELKLIKRKVN